jgi:hypothetical protein
MTPETNGSAKNEFTKRVRKQKEFKEGRKLTFIVKIFGPSTIHTIQVAKI